MTLNKQASAYSEESYHPVLKSSVYIKLLKTIRILGKPESFQRRLWTHSADFVRFDVTRLNP